MKAQLILLCLALWGASCLAAAASVKSVDGKIVLPDGAQVPANAEVHLALDTGGVLVSFPTKDGRFSIPGVPNGEHMLEVWMLDYIFPAIKISVNSKREAVALLTGGKPRAVTASVPEALGGPQVQYPLLMRPMSRAEYFETRKPINVMAFLKTPYGMMAGFMLFSLFILPKLKVDPEEYRKMVEERDAAVAAASGSGGGGRRN